MKYFEKWKRTILIVLLPVISYFLLGPLEIYFGNKKDFMFESGDFIWILLGGGIVFLIVTSVPIALLPEKINRILGAFVLGIGVASYIQNMFMNIKLSESNGAPMNWETLGYYPIFNGVIYCGIIVIFIVLSIIIKKHWDKIAIGSAVFLSAIQVVAVVSLVVTAPTKDDTVIELQESGDKQFQVAKNNNIIVFVLDTFGNTQIEKILEAYPNALDGYKDFTFYDNADCHYYVTFPSMTHLLTGMEFDFNSTSEEWLERAWASEKAKGFFEMLKNEKYECNLYSKDVGYVYGTMINLYDKFDNIKPAGRIVNKSFLIKKMVKLSIYRYVPYFVKPYFEVLTKEFGDVTSISEGREVIDDNGKFYQALQAEKLSVNGDMENAFIIQHLFGTHKPYEIDANGQIVKESTQLEVGKGLLTIVEEYLQQLKELDVYDNSVIIIMGDHGAWWGDDTQPIFFIKEQNENNNRIRINSAPISWDDFQATIINLLEKDYSSYGTSIYDWKEGDERERTVYMAIDDEAYPKVEGSIPNVYYMYSYSKDKTELNRKVKNGPDDILPATPWR